MSAEREGHPLGGGALWWRVLRLSIEPGYGLVGGFIPRGGGLPGPRTRFGFFSIVVYVLAGFSVLSDSPGREVVVY